ncbi:MAG: DUF2283 domain-containing protein [Candidatus Thorarchaeota archaeon]
MRVDYDEVADSIYFRLNGGVVADSIEMGEGVVVDYDAEGSVCGIEILAFSKRNLDLNRLVKMKDEELIAEVATV